MAQFQVVAKYIMRNKNGGGFGLLFNFNKQRTMQKSVFLIIVALFSLSANAVRLNLRGEKMVSEIRVDYSDSSALPYLIKLGYDNMGELNSLVFERQAIAHETVKIHRNEDGNIIREDFSDNKKISQYEIQVDAEKRPVEMTRYDIEKQRPLKIGTFCYDYDFQDYALSIIHRDAEDNYAALRESVKIMDNNAYVFYNVINLTNGNESKSCRRDKNVSYSSYDNDMNVDISQIIRGTCNVGGRLLNLDLDSNFFMLVQWIPVKSQKMLSTIWFEKMEYNFDGDVLRSVDVKYSLTDKPHYTIYLSYLD